MSIQIELNELARRKRLLVLEAGLHRGLIAAERASLRVRLGRLEGVRANLVPAGPWLLAGGVLAGVVAVRHWRKMLGWIPTALAAWRWLNRLRPG